ncbi:AAEL008937-PA [Aedes aegypti]|uniref:AAEL008937-PA n=1 Tax=Aedes aegypti TaxID=7159 RepID=Q16XA8_AEDAE|nr:AAEL008937-PA [Aedes aegypti]
MIDPEPDAIQSIRRTTRVLSIFLELFNELAAPHASWTKDGSRRNQRSVSFVAQLLSSHRRHLRQTVAVSRAAYCFLQRIFSFFRVSYILPSNNCMMISLLGV